MVVFYIFLNPAREAIFARRCVSRTPALYRERLSSMTSATARARTMAGLWLLEQYCAAHGWTDAHYHRMGLGPGGKPEFASGPFFSISHSRQLIACACDPDHPIGIDVEFRRQKVSPKLRKTIAPTGDFFINWCAREATVKASGHVGLARIRATKVERCTAILDEQRWFLSHPELAPDYSCCIASPMPVPANSPVCHDLGDRIPTAPEL